MSTTTQPGWHPLPAYVLVAVDRSDLVLCKSERVGCGALITYRPHTRWGYPRLHPAPLLAAALFWSRSRPVHDQHRGPTKRYILPTTDWAALVPIIIRDAQSGAVLEVHTEAMADLVRRALEAAGRADLHLVVRTPRTGQEPQAA